MMFFVDVCLVEPFVVFWGRFEVDGCQRRKLNQVVGVSGEVVDALGGIFFCRVFHIFYHPCEETMLGTVHQEFQRVHLFFRILEFDFAVIHVQNAHAEPFGKFEVQ